MRETQEHSPHSNPQDTPGAQNDSASPYPTLAALDITVIEGRFPLPSHYDPSNIDEIITFSSNRPPEANSAGGLVVANRQALEGRPGAIKKRQGARWIGAKKLENADDMEQGGLEEAARTAAKANGYDVLIVGITEEENTNYYLGMSNEVLWPIFHGFPDKMNFKPEYWDAYKRVNRKFAKAILEEQQQDDSQIRRLDQWHDYHHMLINQMIHEEDPDHIAEHYLHIPFPTPEHFAHIPKGPREDLLRGYLHNNLLGFQTDKDVDNFAATVRNFLPDVTIEKTPDGLTFQFDDTDKQGQTRRRVALAEAFPIGIDVEHMQKQASRSEVQAMAENLLNKFPSQKILFDASRQDYTKGIAEGIRAVGRALETYQDMRGEIVLIQADTPSRRGIRAYDELDEQIMAAENAVNEAFQTASWKPIHRIPRALNDIEMQAHLSSAHIAYIKTLVDGQNLVIHEYAAIGPKDGVLIGGVHAGAMIQVFKDIALPIDLTATGDPEYDEAAKVIYKAFTMPKAERVKRMDDARARAAQNNVHTWFGKRLERQRRIHSGL